MGRKLAEVGRFADPMRFMRWLAKLEPSAVAQLGELLSPETASVLRAEAALLGAEKARRAGNVLQAVQLRAEAALLRAEAGPHGRTAVARLNSAVEKWAGDFRICSPFVLEVAAYTLREWATWPARFGHRSKQREFMVAVAMYSSGASDELEAKMLPRPARGQEIDTAGGWSEAMAKRLLDTDWLPAEKRASDVIARDRARLGPGMVATLPRRSDAQLKAFVRWQVQQWTLGEVAEALRVYQRHKRAMTAHAANKLMREIAAELGFTPRAAARGRPRGSNQ